MFKKILSPWAEIDVGRAIGINERVQDLNGCRIGLFAHFKQHALVLLEEVQARLAERFPTASFTTLQYTRECMEIENDPEFQKVLLPWLKDVDVVVAAYGDMGSCALFLSYNLAYIERQGVPVVMLCDKDFYNTSRRGADARLVSGMRIVTTPMHDLSFVPALDESIRERLVRPAVESCLEELIAALTEPLTEAERTPVQKDNGDAHLTFEGSYDEINRAFYLRGWTDGSPIVPPTEEAVAEMCRGTDLPRDHVVATLAPLNGKATVEKIAINGLIAGCTPTMMPILIAIAEGMGDHEVIKLEGWTCSNAGWLPTIVVSGPIRKAIGINAGRNFLSAYTRPQACIARAMAYMIMNISGVRSQTEDMSGPGSDSRFGLCVAEDEENSPWETLPADLGLEDGDNAVTLFWPSEHHQLPVMSPSACLDRLCHLWHGGFDVGMMITLPPEGAKVFADAGYTKQDILNYVKEYNRRPSSEIPRAAIGNNHPRKGLVFPADGLVHSAPLMWNTDHSFVMVAGRDWGMAYLGGGDHGGPICKKAVLPKDWDALCEKYPGTLPQNVDY